VYQLWRDQTLYQILSKSTDPRRSYSDLKIKSCGPIATLNLIIGGCQSSCDMDPLTKFDPNRTIRGGTIATIRSLLDKHALSCTAMSERAWRQQFDAQRRLFQSKFTTFWLETVNSYGRNFRALWRAEDALFNHPGSTLLRISQPIILPSILGANSTVDGRPLHPPT